jgi:hypothetical protein
MYWVLGSLVSLCGLQCAGPSLVLISVFGFVCRGHGRAQTARTVGTTADMPHLGIAAARQIYAAPSVIGAVVALAWALVEASSSMGRTLVEPQSGRCLVQARARAECVDWSSVNGHRCGQRFSVIYGEPSGYR